MSKFPSLSSKELISLLQKGGAVFVRQGSTGQTQDRLCQFCQFKRGFSKKPRKCQALPQAEIDTVSQWLTERKQEGLSPHEIGLFVRSSAQLDRAHSAVEKTGLLYKVLDENVETISGHVSIGTMHLAKGLEFRAVVVMACDDEIIPLQERIETVADDSDLEEVYETERHLLYVACTRARDNLLVTSGDTPSEFLDDLKIKASNEQ